jgi:hydrogenase expression/formation protein HypE
MPSLGKLGPEFLQKAVLGKLGADSAELLQGPSFGVDNAVIRVAPSIVAVCKTDPVSLIPSLGVANSAWLSVHLLASDVTTSGFRPTFAFFDLNLPPRMQDAEVEAYWHGIHRACKELGVAIAGGHTGRFVGCDYTVMGGGFMIALGPEERYLTSNMAQEGDELILTKGAAIATTGILAHAFPETVEQKFGGKFLKAAQAYLSQFSTVNDALIAASAGVRADGVTAMHDVTEGGVFGGIIELLSASRKGARIKKESVVVSNETSHICELFGVDPYKALSEGSLLISAKPKKVERVQALLSDAGIRSSRLGKIVGPENGIMLVDESGERTLEYPEEDTYWAAYWRAADRGWR